MAAKENRIEKFKAGCRTTSSNNAEKNIEFNKDLFDREWEVFVNEIFSRQSRDVSNRNFIFP